MTAQTSNLPAPPPPTPEEQEERARRWREEQDRLEAERIANAEKRTAEAKAAAEKALTRLMEASRMEAEVRATGEQRRPEGIPGVQYEFVDMTEQKAVAARKLWLADLESIHDDFATDEGEEGDDDERDPHPVSPALWRLEDVEDPRAREAVRHFIENLRGGKKRNAIVFGSVGAGKTSVLVAAGHYAVDRGIGARFVSHAEYLSHLRPEGAPPNGMSKVEYRRMMRDCALLVLDDLCAELNVDTPASEFVRRETMDLLGYRLTKRLPNLVSTNLTTAQVQKVLDDRLASRLGMNAVVVPMVERDRRKPKTWGA
jgi:hypothetical protein